MERPTLKSVLWKNKQQTHRSVEELDERSVSMLFSPESHRTLFSLPSYYAMDRSTKYDAVEEPDAEPNGEAEEEPEEEEETVRFSHL
jgi:hypothetical protein